MLTGESGSAIILAFSSLSFAVAFCHEGPGSKVIAIGRGEATGTAKSFTLTANGIATGFTPSADTTSLPKYTPAGWSAGQRTCTQKLCTSSPRTSAAFMKSSIGSGHQPSSGFSGLRT